MKGILQPSLFREAMLVCAVVLPLLASCDAQAGRITLSDPEEIETGGQRRICIYEAGNGETYTITTRSQKCPYTKTFDRDDAE